MIKRRAIVFVLLTCVLFLVPVGCSHSQMPTNTNADAKQPDKLLFDHAMDSMKKGRFQESRTLLVTLINTYPDSGYIAQAKLALGDAWYAEGSFKQAELEYQDFITYFPNRPEVAQAKLKIESIQKESIQKKERM